MSNHANRTMIRAAGVSMLAIMAANAAMAQTPSSRQTAIAAPEEIIVTARKRDESILKAPVIMQAISQKQIENLHIAKIEDIQAASPGLQIAYGFALAGITVNLRGLGNGGSANYADQDVALNIDGFTTNSGTFFRQGLFDAAQIEVMKGPQALFYGKSTAAGIISIHSADPTPQWDTSATVGYEFNADEMNLSGYVSGPITDTLGIRIAGYHNTMKGFLTNPNPTNPQRRVPEQTNDGGRLTLKYDNPDVGLRVKFKASFTKDSGKFWQGSLNQSIACPPGGNLTPIFSAYDDCRGNTTASGEPVGLPYNPNGDFSAFNNAAFATGTPHPIYKDGKAYNTSKTGLAILNIDYDITQGLTFTSVTALDYVKAVDAGPSPTPGFPNLAIGGDSKTQEFSQEIRLTSNWKDRWYNFMLGGLYNPTTRRDHLSIVIPDVAGPGSFGLWTEDSTRLKSETNSVFGQIILTPIDKWELGAGVRYTHVRKHFVNMIAINNYPGFFFPGPSGDTIGNVPQNLRDFSENATTPEFTIRYQPTDELMAFVSYKHGYKGPGFNASLTATTYNAAAVNPFGGEKVKGVEGGVKAQLMERQLTLSATGYLYNYKGLQVSFTNPTTSTVTISNGADARIQGFELEGVYSPHSVPGLTLNAFLNYNDSHYTSFPTAPCYGNQPATAGCTYLPSGASFQNLGGKPLNFAAKWLGTLGASYKWDVNDRYVASFDASMQYSSSYYATPEIYFLGRQKAFATLDLAAHAGPSDGSWDLAVLCRNCTNNFHFVYGGDGGPGSGTIGSSPRGHIARPRQVLVQLTVHPYQE